MRIVQFVTSLAAAAGGVARAVLDTTYALALHSPDDRFDVVSFDRGPFDFPWGSAPPPNLTLHLVPPGSRDDIMCPPLHQLFRRLFSPAENVDILHTHGLWAPVAAKLGAMAASAKIPAIVSVHGMLDPWSVSQKRLKKQVYYTLLEKRRLQRAAALHFTTDAEARKAAPWVPAGPASLVIGIPLSLQAFEHLPDPAAAHSAFPAIDPAAPWILFLSRIHEKKGLDVLIDAVARSTHRAAHLVIAGSGDPAYVRAMEDRARSAGIGGRTHFVGLVRGPEKIALFRRAALLAIPSSQENFGIVFPEALACETPVLITRDVDICQPIVQAGAGLTITRDPADVAKKIDALLADPVAARARGAAGRKWVFSTLQPGAIAAAWIDAYRTFARTPA